MSMPSIGPLCILQAAPPPSPRTHTYTRTSTPTHMPLTHTLLFGSLLECPFVVHRRPSQCCWGPLSLRLVLTTLPPPRQPRPPPLRLALTPPPTAPARPLALQNRRPRGVGELLDQCALHHRRRRRRAGHQRLHHACLRGISGAGRGRQPGGGGARPARLTLGKPDV